RVVDAQHEYAAHRIDDAHVGAVSRPRHIAAVARRTAGIVGRTQKSGLRADVVERLLLVPTVILRGHDVVDVVKYLIAAVARHTEADGGVFRVITDEVD